MKNNKNNVFFLPWLTGRPFFDPRLCHERQELTRQKERIGSESSTEAEPEPPSLEEKWGVGRVEWAFLLGRLRFFFRVKTCFVFFFFIFLGCDLLVGVLGLGVLLAFLIKVVSSVLF